ncbi:MAG: hypothetical protein AAFX76_00175 [Planctomycetota bacterium]
MSLRPITPLNDGDQSPGNAPDLNRGIPGVQWHADARADGPGKPAQLRGSNMPVDDPESYVLYVGLLFGIALVLRLLVVMMGPGFSVDQAYTPQTEHLMALGANLTERGVLGVATQPEGSIAADLDALRLERGERGAVGETGLVAEAYEAPGYPAVLGVLRLSGVSASWLLVVQCVLGALCVPLTYRVGLGVLGRKMPALLGAVFVAVHPGLLVASATLAGDVFVVALVLAGLAAVAHTRQRGIRGAFGGGVALGGAALFAPMLAWLAPLTAAWMVLAERRLASVGLAAVMLFGAALPIGGWVYRNTERGLSPMVTAQPAVDRVFGTLAAVRGEAAGRLVPETRERMAADFRAFALLPANAEADTLSLLRRYGREQLTVLRNEHAAVLGDSAKRLALDHSLDDAYARLGIPYAPAGYAAQLLGEDVASATPEEPVTEWVVNVWVAVNAAMVGAMAVGAVLMVWRRRLGGLVLLLTVMGLFVWMGASGASETLRLPIIGLQGLMIAAIVAPGPLRVKKAKRNKVRKAVKLDETASLTAGSPLATEDSLRPVPPTPSSERVDPDTAKSDDHAVHPALAMAKADAVDEAKDFAAQVADERMKNLAMSGRPI